LPVAVWQSDIELEFNTTYYWKVRACLPQSNTAWSPVSAFITEAEPPVSPVPPETVLSLPEVKTKTTEPAIEPVLQPIITLNLPDWVLYSCFTILAIIALLLVISLGLLVVIAKRSR